MARRIGFLLFAILAPLSFIACFALAAMGEGPLPAARFFATLSVFALLYLVSLGLARRAWTSSKNSWIAILAWGVLFRLPFLFATPRLSDDVYRYVWDGRVALSGRNPFQYSPAAPELSTLRDADWTKINNPDLPTIYPPAAQGLFLVAALVGKGVPGLKVLLVLADLAIALLLLRTVAREEKERWRLLLYWWHPLPILEFAWSGHVDSLGILFLVLAWIVAVRPVPLTRARGLLVGTLTGLSSLVKFQALTALPVLGRRRWVEAALALSVLGLLLYLPYIGHGVNAAGSLSTYVARWRSNDFLFGFFLRPGTVLDQEGRLLEAKIYSLAVLIAVFLLATAFHASTTGRLLAVMGCAVLVSPTIHPWYVAWLLPFVAARFSRAWFSLTLLVLLAYHPLPGFLAGQGWHETGWIRWLEFGTFAAMLSPELYGILRRKAARPSVQAGSGAASAAGLAAE